jgi:hypothetical protein
VVWWLIAPPAGLIWSLQTGCKIGACECHDFGIRFLLCVYCRSAVAWLHERGRRPKSRCVLGSPSSHPCTISHFSRQSYTQLPSSCSYNRRVPSCMRRRCRLCPTGCRTTAPSQVREANVQTHARQGVNALQHTCVATCHPPQASPPSARSASAGVSCTACSPGPRACCSAASGRSRYGPTHAAQHPPPPRAPPLHPLHAHTPLLPPAMPCHR